MEEEALERLEKLEEALIEERSRREAADTQIAALKQQMTGRQDKKVASAIRKSAIASARAKATARNSGRR
jgi:hypothetical protein